MKSTVLALILLGIVTACGSASNQQPATAQKPEPRTISTSDLSKLRWIEGSWRGTGDIDKPFYERYRFENETTLIVEGFDDEGFTKQNDTSRFVLKEGHFGNESEGPRWQATAIDDTSITFSPVVKAANTFRWERESDNVWKATLNWPAKDNSPAKQRIYRMERIPPK